MEARFGGWRRECLVGGGAVVWGGGGAVSPTSITTAAVISGSVLHWIHCDGSDWTFFCLHGRMKKSLHSALDSKAANWQHCHGNTEKKGTLGDPKYIGTADPPTQSFPLDTQQHGLNKAREERADRIQSEKGEAHLQSTMAILDLHWCGRKRRRGAEMKRGNILFSENTEKRKR
ncbi:hypothetical protein J6590_044722 [Homalodisca vitripennis]|nr:hypothetical protein J6590_044722 [Homalodisca vitripennis]